MQTFCRGSYERQSWYRRVASSMVPDWCAATPAASASVARPSFDFPPHAATVRSRSPEATTATATRRRWADRRARICDVTMLGLPLGVPSRERSHDLRRLPGLCAPGPAASGARRSMPVGGPVGQPPVDDPRARDRTGGRARHPRGAGRRIVRST